MWSVGRFKPRVSPQNTYPAQGSYGDLRLSLGAALGTIAVVTKQEILLVIVGGIFVMEVLSVMIQVISYRLRGKRVFRMAPIHHHFELKALGRAEDHRPILDYWNYLGACGDQHTEVEMKRQALSLPTAGRRFAQCEETWRKWI